MHKISASFSLFAFISQHFARIFKYVAQLCNCMIAAFRNSAALKVGLKKPIEAPVALDPIVILWLCQLSTVYSLLFIVVSSVYCLLFIVVSSVYCLLFIVMSYQQSSTVS